MGWTFPIRKTIFHYGNCADTSKPNLVLYTTITTQYTIIPRMQYLAYAFEYWNWRVDTRRRAPVSLNSIIILPYIMDFPGINGCSTDRILMCSATSTGYNWFGQIGDMVRSWWLTPKALRRGHLGRLWFQLCSFRRWLKRQFFSCAINLVTWEDCCSMFLDSEIGTFMGAWCFDIEITQNLYL
jgi:hypothetical protein